MKKTLFTAFLKTLFISSFVFLSACSFVGNNEELSSNNLWSKESSKPGINANNSKLNDHFVTKNFDVNKLFDLNLKMESLKKEDNSKMTVAELVTALYKEVHNSTSTSNKFEPFNDQNKAISYSNSIFDTFKKANKLNKYFTNPNVFFPSWLIYDFQFQKNNDKLEVLITIINPHLESTDVNWQSSWILTFNLDNNTLQKKEATDKKITNNPIPQPPANSPSPTPKQVTNNYDWNKAYEIFGTFVNAPSGYNKSTFTTKVKELLTTYAEVANKTSNDNSSAWSQIQTSALAKWAYSSEYNKTKKEQEALDKVTNNLKLTEDTKNSKLEFWVSTFNDLSYLAYAIRLNTLIENYDQAKIIKTLKAVLTDLFETYYYGEKTADNQIKSSKQKIYKNWFYYEQQLPLFLANIFAWTRDKSSTSVQSFLGDALSVKYQTAINYFIEDVSKVWSTDKSRYIVPNPYTTKRLYNSKYAIDYLYIKLLSNVLAQDGTKAKTTIDQFVDWMQNTIFEPFNANPPNDEWTASLNKTDKTKDEKLMPNLLSLIDFIRKIYSVLSNGKFDFDKTKMLEPIMNFVKTSTDDMAKIQNSIETNAVKLNIVGILHLLAKYVNDSEAIDKLKEIFSGKQEKDLTALNSTYGWLKKDIVALLAKA